MSETFRVSTLTLVVLTLALAGCGKDRTKTTSQTKVSAQSESTSANAETTVAAPDTGTVNEKAYKSSDDPKVVYSASDLPGRGSYLKLDFTELSSNELNRVIHRLRSEDCTCGCQGDLIDECLVNDPDCTSAVTLAKQIIREEKAKS